MAKKDKYFLLSNKFYFPHFGGVETTVKSHADFLSKYYNFKINVLVSNEKYSLKTNIVNESLNLSIIKSEQLGVLFSMPISLRYFFYFIVYARKSDVVFLHEPWPLGTISMFVFNLFFKKRKQKTIIFWHSDTKKLPIIDQILHCFQKYNLKHSNYILVNMKEVLNNSKIKENKSLDKKIYELPTPISFFCKNKNIPNEIKKIVKIAKEKNQELFIFYGRLAKYKGIKVLLQALSLISKKNLIIVFGEGSLENLLHKEKKHHKNLIFINRYITDIEKKFVLKESTAFLFPSISNSETLGLTQIEALSQGCPVINTNIKTAVPYVSIEGITGKTVEPNNYIELANAINEFPLKNNKEWKKLSTNAKERYNNLMDARSCCA